jgi:hypothetical protein
MIFHLKFIVPLSILSRGVAKPNTLGLPGLMRSSGRYNVSHEAWSPRIVSSQPVEICRYRMFVSINGAHGFLCWTRRGWLLNIAVLGRPFTANRTTSGCQIAAAAKPLPW